MKILCIETATTLCSIGIANAGKLVALKEVNEGYSHAERIEGLIDDALTQAGMTLSDLDAIAVGKGPGSYTGLRIGVSLAKGLCLGLNIPLIAVNTLATMARHPKVMSFSGVRIPMLDARRMEVYTAGFNSAHEEVFPTQAIVVDGNSFDFLPDTPVVFMGPGMDKCKEALSHISRAVFLDDIWPSAEGMVGMATEKAQEKAWEDVAYFEPFYLKDFVAGKPKKLL